MATTPRKPQPTRVRRPRVAGATRPRPGVTRGSGTSLRKPAAVAKPATPIEAPEPAAETPPRRLRWLHVAILAAIAATLAVFAVVAWQRPGADVDNEAYVDTAATSQVKAETEHALQAISQYSFDKMDDWVAASHAVLTDSMKADFDKTVDVTKQAAAQARTVTQVHVSDVAVNQLQGDHAEVAAYLVVSVENNGTAAGSSQGPQLVRMQKVGDRWLLAAVILD